MHFTETHRNTQKPFVFQEGTTTTLAPGQIQQLVEDTMDRMNLASWKEKILHRADSFSVRL